MEVEVRRGVLYSIMADASFMPERMIASRQKWESW